MKLVHVDSKEPHALRRKNILREFPEIKQFFGIEWRTKYLAVCLVIIQLTLSIIASKSTWPMYCILLYFFSASISQTLFLINHECAHNLAFQSTTFNILLGYVVNLPSIFPYTASFRTYHLMHHKHQGSRELDADLPTDFEVKLMQNHVGRCAWLSFQIIAYALRPVFVNPLPISYSIILNCIIQLLFNIGFFHLYGSGPFLYLFTTMIISGSWHPCAMHFISEHTHFENTTIEVDTFDLDDWTIIGTITLNVHHHRMHHDFSKIPWTKLPAATTHARKYYPSQKQNWWSVLTQFISGKAHRTIRESKKFDEHKFK